MMKKSMAALILVAMAVAAAIGGGMLAGFPWSEHIFG